MRIIGFNFLKIIAERKDELDNNLSLNQKIDIKDVQKEKVPFSDKDIIRVDFNFVLSYSKDSAKIQLTGYIFIVPEKNELKEILKSWKDKKLPEDIRIPLFNFIMNKCNVKCLTLENELNLPYHLPLPKISKQTK